MNQYAKGAAPSPAFAEILCDLRSDTVTRPDAPMRAAMAAAEVGDDVMGDDPTVQRLEARVAEAMGKDAGLFLPSGTQSNLIAMLSHCARGEEVITGRGYHVYKYEAGGASALGGIVLDPLPVPADGLITPAQIAGAVKEDDSHMPVSRLLSLENTHNGKAIPAARLVEAVAVARGVGLSAHLDGARIYNAANALGCAPEQIAAPFDTVSVCLSKGLGAPVGSVLVGPSAFIATARRWRKMLGGGLRQVGVLAAAGLYALDHNVECLGEDHAKAERLAEDLRSFGAGAVEQNSNMVFFTPEGPEGPEAPGGPDGNVNLALQADLAKAGIAISTGPRGPIRMVLHKDVTDPGFDHLRRALRNFFG